MLSSNTLNLRRLLRLRTVSLLAQGAVIWLAVASLHMALPLAPLALILAGLAALTALAWRRLGSARPVSDGELFMQLVVDVAALTAALYLTGGWTNPLVLLYFLPITIAAAALPSGYTWSVAGLTAACYTLLVFRNVPLPHAHTHGDFGLHVTGMWIGFVLSAGLIAFFVARMGQALREQDRMLAELRENELRNERLLALASLAAGAAHELGTPLATLAVLVGELERDAQAPGGMLRIMRTQISRCKEILSTLTAAGGQRRAESGSRVALDEYLQDLFSRWREMRPGIYAEVRLRGTCPAPQIVADETLGQAILNVLNNAADASPDNVEVEASWNNELLSVAVSDRGAGFAAPPAQQDAAATSFGTKDPAQGLGLGLFLTQATLQRLNGALRLANRPDGGARCSLTLPLQPLRVPA